jgi:cytochrome P450
VNRVELVYDPYDVAVNHDPYPLYARMRREQPLHHAPGLGIRVLSRHADVAAALADSARYSSDHGPLLDPGGWSPRARAFLSFLAMDPPEHSRMRAVVSRAFTPRRVAALEPMIRRLARGHAERAVELGGFDFAADLSARLPREVITELMGVPPSDRAEVSGRNASLMKYDPDGTITEAALRPLLSLGEYYASVVAERRGRPRDDLVSVLVADGDLTDDEIVGFMILLVGAGSETTTHLLNAAWYWAWRNPAQRAAAFAGAVGAWVEESLRYDTPAHGTARRLTEPTDLYGTRLPAGTKMWLLIGSANRDETVFPDPGAYDLSRDTSKSIAFGLGRHFCLGASLARLEARVMLEELTRLVSPGYDVDDAGVVRMINGNVRGLVKLPTTVKAG